MRIDFVRKDLLKYINENIKPMYKTFDKAHNLNHYKFVTENCVNYAKKLLDNGKNVDLEISYVVGALHDVGIAQGREGHAKSSGKFVRSSVELKEFFDDETIEMIAQAVEDHSSHLEYEPRSIYGKIVADADRNNTVYLVFSRPTKYGLKHEPNLSRSEQIDRVYEFVQGKFGRTGYVKYWLDIDDTKKEQEAVWSMLDDEKSCKLYIGGIIDEITKGKLK